MVKCMNALGALRSRCYDVLYLPTFQGLVEQLHENRTEINGTLDRLARLSGSGKEDALRLRSLFTRSISAFGTDTAEDLLNFSALVHSVLTALPDNARPAAGDVSMADIAARVHARLHKNGPRGRDALDIWIRRVDDAANAVWNMMGSMETGGIAHMGQMVSMDEDTAFDKFFPKESRAVEPLARFMVANAMHEQGLCFDYWSSKSPMLTKPSLIYKF